MVDEGLRTYVALWVFDLLTKLPSLHFTAFPLLFPVELCKFFLSKWCWFYHVSRPGSLDPTTGMGSLPPSEWVSEHTYQNIKQAQTLKPLVKELLFLSLVSVSKTYPLTCCPSKLCCISQSLNSETRVWQTYGGMYTNTCVYLKCKTLPMISLAFEVRGEEGDFCCIS